MFHRAVAAQPAFTPAIEIAFFIFIYVDRHEAERNFPLSAPPSLLGKSGYLARKMRCVVCKNDAYFFSLYSQHRHRGIVAVLDSRSYLAHRQPHRRAQQKPYRHSVAERRDSHSRALFGDRMYCAEHTSLDSVYRFRAFHVKFINLTVEVVQLLRPQPRNLSPRHIFPRSHIYLAHILHESQRQISRSAYRACRRPCAEKRRRIRSVYFYSVEAF
ncbi:hypothetical protein SDC9_177385 [bioreactor metagenome]|uniref:Uncharacterized protein n=1 Tax=bioreactor metagenome TaxID=1076179 RepID=A0A645GSV7_9ZZZZ